MTAQQLEDIVHAKRLAQAIVDRAHELKVRGLVDGPAAAGQVRVVRDVDQAEQLRVLPDEGGDVLPLRRCRRFPPRAGEGCERKSLRVETVGKRGRHRRSRSEEHTSELQSPCNLVCRLLLEKKKKKQQ